MNNHPYVRAYMAGITVPTIVLLIGVTLFAVAKATLRISVPLERLIIFPMAIVPNLWGLWNILYLSLGLRGRISIGVYGAALPFLLIPLGMLLAWKMQMFDFMLPLFAGALPVAVLLYYLLWKLVVDRLNETLGIA
jgi:hypothetical protein